MRPACIPGPLRQVGGMMRAPPARRKSSCMSANRKLTFTRANVWLAKPLSPQASPAFRPPPGHYTVVSKDAGHVSTVFGDYVDDYGNVVKSNIDSRKDSRPKGTHFDGARMPY